MIYKPREIEGEIIKWLNQGYSIVIVGPRQAGKTTLLKHMAEQRNGLYLTLDDPDVLAALSNVKVFMKLYNVKGELYLDEAQYDPGIGRKLKYIHDVEQVRFVATGSGSFDIKVKVTGELVGRIFRKVLLPLSFHEYITWLDPRLGELHDEVRDRVYAILSGEEPYNSEEDLPGLRRLWEEYIVYGGYPRVVLTKDTEVKKEMLNQIITAYIDRDIMGFLGVREHLKFRRTLIALASISGGLLKKQTLQDVAQASYQTIDSYLSLLEETFIVFTVHPYPTGVPGMRKQPKIYFYDTGVRNGLIGNFQPIQLRPDSGALLESYVARHLKQKYGKIYYWKTKSGGEVDFIVNNIPIEAKITPTPNKALHYAAEKLGSSRKVLITPSDKTLGGKRDIVYIKPWLL